jgi:cobalt-zinc-cadmium efflux system outer membrane protein
MSMFLRLIPFGALCALAGFGIFAEPAAANSEAPAVSTGENVLTLDEALALTLRGSPDLTAALEDLRAVEFAALQAGRLPNPELTVTLENVAGDGTYQDTDAAELTIELSQPVELGDKRRLRREAAEFNRQLAAHEQTLANVSVLAAVRQKFVAVLAAQEELALARDQAELAEKSLGAAEERIEAGKAPLIDRLRLQGEASLARLAVEKAERTLVTAGQALAASWGDAQPAFNRVAGNLSSLPEIPDPIDTKTAWEQNPDTTRRRLASALLANELAQAKARRIPDPSLTVGWRQFEESAENALLFGVSFPLPLFSHGQDEVAAASHRLNGVKARELAARMEAGSALQAARQAFADARAEAEVLGRQVVPGATDGFAAAEFGYRAGKFGLIELIDAQRALFEARHRQLAAQVACHLASIELYRLLGREPGAVTP